MKLQHEFQIAEDAAGASPASRRTRQTTVAAVVVLYYPNPDHLLRISASVAEQVDSIFVIDNTPGESDGLPSAFQGCARPVCYHANGTNRGIATAQNTGIDWAIREGCTHVLLLDQDSTLPPDAVKTLLAAEQALLEAGTNVAAVGPQFIDVKDGKRGCTVGPGWIRVRWIPIPADETHPVECDYLIASGSLIRTSVLSTVGRMRDELFIDWVDAEWAYRAKSLGYTTYVVPTVTMLHSIGEETGCFLGKSFNLHGPARNYYIVRNAAYLLKERRMSWRWRVAMLPYIPKYILLHSWLSSDPWLSFRQMVCAVWEGLAGTMRPFASQ